MPSDLRASQARQHHRDAAAANASAAASRAQRNRIVRQLRAEDPAAWSYTVLAKAVGCSKELIAVILRDGDGA